jgi:hypothetical protein
MSPPSPLGGPIPVDVHSSPHIFTPTSRHWQLSLALTMFLPETFNCAGAGNNEKEKIKKIADKEINFA